ncbi:lipase family protein [Verrucomicrobium sp. BvORR106]|uniref:lipase family protein n=1 Tax=Verrucomicrobium sp. BvORR106 TaxID=1403819 RepID=UPI00069076B6|nr:lipase family protein [Verrucomicrobium sp. BvORR106]
MAVENEAIASANSRVADLPGVAIDATLMNMEAGPILAVLPAPTPENLYPPCRHAAFFACREDHPFQPGARGFSLVNASWLADAALLAYDPEGDYLNEVWAQAGFREVRVLDGRSSRVVVAAGRDAIIVAFRGTQVFWPGRPAAFGAVMADWLTDARTGLVASGHGGEVHEGFKAALDQVWQPLSAVVEQLRHEHSGRALWVTGHSLGGALASLAAQRWAEQVAGVYTYGSPLVGDEGFSRGFVAPSHRFVHQADLITEVPLFGLRLALPTGWARYTHVGVRHWIDEAGHLHVGDAVAAAPSVSLAQELTALVRDKLTGTALTLQHHAPLYYALRLRQNLELMGRGPGSKSP